MLGSTNERGAAKEAAELKKRGTAARGKHRPLQAVLKEGLEAALRADPEVLEHCKPKTGAGLIVRALVLEAGKGKVTALKELMSLLDREDEPQEDEDAEETSEEPRWDWNKEGNWQTLPEPKPANDAAEEADHPARIELKRRLRLLMQGNDEDKARAARIIQKMRNGTADEFAREAGIAA